MATGTLVAIIVIIIVVIVRIITVVFKGSCNSGFVVGLG